MKTYLALDQSTSATKAYLFAEDGYILKRASREHAQLTPQPGWVEHDANEIWRHSLKVLREVLAHAPALPEFLAITNQRETVVAWEFETGRPLGNALVWQDRRGDDLCACWKANGFEEEIRERTGLVADSYFSGAKIAWLMEREPAAARALNIGKARVGTIDAYLIFRLTGGQTFATDSTNASRTLLYNIREHRWDETLRTTIGCPAPALPEVRPSGADFGATTLDGYLDKPLPIRGVMGDSQAALYAHRVREPGTAKVTLGTGSSVLLSLGESFARSPDALTALAWERDGQATYAFEGLINYSAATLAWQRDQLKLFTHDDEIEPLCTSVPDNGGVYLVPAFGGLGTPYWQPQARAAFIGMTAGTTRAHLVRAGVEAMAFQIDAALQAMLTSAPVPLKNLRVDGGAARNGFLLQFLADLLNVPLVVPPVTALSPWGAVLMGLGDDLPPAPEPERIVEPRADFPRDELRAAWAAAVQRVC